MNHSFANYETQQGSFYLNYRPDVHHDHDLIHDHDLTLSPYYFLQIQHLVEFSKSS